MKHLQIKNIGPIKFAEVDFKRYNFIIGPQSSGKSTVAKILSTCTWLEKEVATTADVNTYSDHEAFLSLFEDFHKMETYFDGVPEIHYETEVIKIDYENGIPNIRLKDGSSYQRQKICYIPSERNVVTLPELQGFEFGQTNLRSFLFDWFNAREYFNSDNKTDILNLGVRYYYDPEEKKYKDRIEHENGNTYRMPLGSASSGLQSVIPLLVMLQYYSGEYFNSYSEKTSFDTETKAKNIRKRLTDECVLKKAFADFDPSRRSDFVAAANEKLHNGNPYFKQLYNDFRQEYERLTVPVRTDFIIEEPEQNLYPETQTDLMDFIVGLLNDGRGHSLTVTTHSPYILNQLNLMFKRFDVDKSNMAKLDFDDVTVFAIDSGSLVDLKLGNAHLVNPEFLSEPIDRIYKQYESLDDEESAGK